MTTEKVYLLIIEDRHTDPDVLVYRDQAQAVAEARGKAMEYAKWCRWHVEEKKVEGWLYYARYSCEGDCVRVVEAEVR